MKGYRFYLEHETRAKRRRGEHTGNVLALYLDDETGRPWWNGYGYECVSAILAQPNSPVTSCTVSPHVLQDGRYKRIPEARAREVHPELFAYLEAPD